jgi:hypothetical protein
MADTAELGRQLAQQVLQLTARLLQTRPESLSDMEQQMRTELVKLGQVLLTAWLGVLEESYPAEAIPCPCGGQADYQGQREGTLLTLVGQVRYRRAYYLCPQCHQGCCPMDQRLGLRPGQMSAEVESLAGMTGVQVPFGQGSALFEALTLVSLSDHSLAKATQDMGAEVQAQEREWIQQSQDEGWLQEQERLAGGPARLYGALDAVKVHVRGDGEHPWRDLKVGAWFTSEARAPQSPDEAWEMHASNITYYSDICEAQQLGPLVWATGCQRRAQLAGELVFLGDGAEWIWKLVQEHYPEAVQIVDWFHAAEHITPLAQAVFGAGDQRETWMQQMRAALWNGELETLIAQCERYSEDSRGGEAAREAATYFQNNRQRMRYPEYRARGYHIGSGTIESGCKQIATQRLKVSGAIWNLDNAIKTAKARGALLSGQWQAIAARRRHLPLPLAA